MNEKNEQAAYNAEADAKGWARKFTTEEIEAERTRQRKVVAVAKDLEREQGREPTEEEIAAEVQRRQKLEVEEQNRARLTRSYNRAVEAYDKLNEVVRENQSPKEPVLTKEQMRKLEMAWGVLGELLRSITFDGPAK